MNRIACWCFLIFLLAASTVGATDMFFNQLKAEKMFELPYFCNLPDMESCVSFLLDFFGDTMVIQDLNAGVVLFVDPVKKTVLKQMKFPSGLLSLAIVDEKTCYCLFQSGLKKVDSLQHLESMFANKATTPFDISFHAKDLEGKPRDFRLKVSPEEMYFIFNLPSRRIDVFSPQGEKVNTYICDRDFHPSSGGHFLSSNFSRTAGLYFRETVVETPKEAIKPKEYHGYYQEMNLPNLRATIIRFDENTQKLLAALQPPFDDGQNEASFSWSWNPAVPKQIFSDATNSTMLYSIVVSVEKGGTVKPLAKYPFAETEGKLALHNSTLYHVMPGKSSQTRLESLAIFGKSLK